MKRVFNVLIVLILLSFCSCNNNHLVAENKEDNDFITDTFSGKACSVSITYPSGKLLYGSSFEIIIKLVYPIDKKYILLPLKIENNEEYANTVINSINEKDSGMSSDGMAESVIIFNIEAWLPGNVFFPPLSVLFPQEISTDKLVFEVVSSFNDNSIEKQLSSIIIPNQMTTRKSILIFVVLAILIIMFLLSVIIIKNLKKRKNKKTLQKTQKDMLEDFKKKFIDKKEDFDMRAAFFSITAILPDIDDANLKILINKAKFSKEGVSMQEGKAALYKLYKQALSLQAIQEEAKNDF